MEDNLQPILVFFISIIILFVFPVYFAYEKKDDIAYALVLRYTQDFTNDVKAKGYITKDDYDEFVDRLDSTGNKYDINMTHTYVKSSPGKTEQSYINSDETYSNQYILNYINNHGAYLMNEKDKFSVKVKNTNTTIATILYNIVTIQGSDINTRIYVFCSSEILKAKWFNNSKYMNFYTDEVSIANKFVAKAEDTFERNLAEGETSIVNSSNILISNTNLTTNKYTNNFTIEFQVTTDKNINIELAGTLADYHLDSLGDPWNEADKVGDTKNNFNYMIYSGDPLTTHNIAISVGQNGISVFSYFLNGSKTRMCPLISYAGEIKPDSLYKIAFRLDPENTICIFEDDKRIEYETTQYEVNITKNKAYINKDFIGDIKSIKIYKTS